MTGLWYAETESDDLIYMYRYASMVSSQVSPFQEIAVLDGVYGGKALFINGRMQSCTSDEHLYHEALVHPALVQHGAARRVLVLGGGEGATLREVLRWRMVEAATMVELDAEVVELCRRALPEMNAGAFEDPRTTVIVADAFEYLRAQERWDVIILDLTDPADDPNSRRLFSEEMFASVAGCLEPGGVAAVQVGPVTPGSADGLRGIVDRLRRHIPHVQGFTIAVPSFCQPWGLLLASDRPLPDRVDPDEVDRMLARSLASAPRAFDGRTLVGLLHPPLHVRSLLMGPLAASAEVAAP